MRARVPFASIASSRRAFETRVSLTSLEKGRKGALHPPARGKKIIAVISEPDPT